MKTFKYFTLLLLVFSSFTTFSQNPKRQALITDALNKENIKNQFFVLIDKSPTYQDFKNIRFKNLNKLKSNILDTLKAYDEKYVIAKTKIKEQVKEIEQLKASINKINTNLSEVTVEKDSIEIFGIQTTKATYNLTLWSLILGLLATTLIFLFRFRSSNRITKESNIAFNEIETEFETHRKKSLEREQVLRRKLQDEINKQRNA